MTSEVKQTIVAALMQYRGDNFARASQAFRGYTPDQMAQQHGLSGETRQAVLDGYREHVERVDRAIAEVKARS